MLKGIIVFHGTVGENRQTLKSNIKPMLKTIATDLKVTKFYFDSIIISLNAIRSPLSVR